APDIAAERHPGHAGRERLVDLADEAVVVALAVAAQDDDRHGGALDDAAHAVGIARVERLDVVGAHFGRLAAHAGDVVRGVLVALVEAARDDLGLQWHPPALTAQGVALQSGPLHMVT